MVLVLHFQHFLHWSLIILDFQQELQAVLRESIPIWFKLVEFASVLEESQVVLMPVAMRNFHFALLELCFRLIAV